MWLLISLLPALTYASLEDCRQALQDMITSTADYLNHNSTDSQAARQLYYSGRGINELGNYSGCQQLENSRYVILRQEIVRVQYMTGLCVPDICTGDEIEDILTANSPDAVNIDIISNPEHSLGFLGYLTIVLIFVLMGLAIAGTRLDLKEQAIVAQTGEKPRGSKAQAILKCFSWYTNFGSLITIKPGKEPEPLDSLNGLRVLSMLWVISGHVFAFRGNSPLRNVDRVPHVFGTYGIAIFGYTGFFAVDSFFWLTAFLLVFIFYPQYERKRGRMGAMGWLMYYVNRFLRIIPMYGFMLLLYLTVLPALGSGPLWFSVDNITEDCDDYWWANVFFLSNFIPNYIGSGCFGVGWYLSNEMQMFWISPIIIMVYYTAPKWVAWLFGLLLNIASMITTWAIATEFEFGVPIIYPTNFGKHNYMQDLYQKPYCRITPYIIGMYCGFIYLEMKREVPQDPIARKIGQWLNPGQMLSYVVFLLGSAIILFIIFIQVPAYKALSGESEAWSPEAHAFVVGIRFFVYSIGLTIAWMPMILGGARQLKIIFGWRYWAPVAKVAFAAFLVHYGIMVSSFALEERENIFNFIQYYHAFISITCISFVGAVLLYMFVEVPFMLILKMLLMPRRPPPQAQTEEKNQLG